jgi:hypothetical protein
MKARRCVWLATVWGTMAIAAACVRTGRRSADDIILLVDASQSPAGGVRHLIGPQELQRVDGTTALEAVRQLRPEFLRGHARSRQTGQPNRPAVYINTRHEGGVDVLGTIPLVSVVEIRYLDPVMAKGLFGSYCSCEAGVIQLRVR